MKLIETVQLTISPCLLVSAIGACAADSLPMTMRRAGGEGGLLALIALILYTLSDLTPYPSAHTQSSPSKGLLLLSMTNRYTHLTNRIRGVKTLEEKQTLFRRVRMIKRAILLALLSVMMLIVLMLVFLVQLLLQRESRVAAMGIFTMALVSLFSSLVLFTFDMKHSLSLIHEMVKEAEAGMV
jgi:hypothetical protein